MTRSYAHYDDCQEVRLNEMDEMMEHLSPLSSPLYFFTLHEIFNRKGTFQQTRSSPNWQGDVATMATCKQQMRSWKTPEEWIGHWLFCFTPRHCSDNALFFAGRIDKTFESNFDYGQYLKAFYPDIWEKKLADYDPRGDVYTPINDELYGEERYDVTNFKEPPGHTRSVETYSDGTPKWWKDIRYKLHERRPPVLMFHPAYLFSEPKVWTTRSLGRAVRTETMTTFFKTLRLN